VLREIQGRILDAVLEGKPLEGADPDGVELARLIVKKLRFELIARGDSAMEAWFDRDPEAFTTAFKAYDALVPPRSWFPREEAEKFRQWCMENRLYEPPASTSKGT
jgi:hypothetical protein